MTREQWSHPALDGWLAETFRNEMVRFGRTPVGADLEAHDAVDVLALGGAARSPRPGSGRPEGKRSASIGAGQET